MKVSGFARMVRDGELKYTASGTALCKGSFAWDNKKGGESSFCEFEAWEKVAEDLGGCHKGEALNIEGYLKQDKWKSKEGENRSKVVIVVTKFERYKGQELDDIPF